jgi:site-specific DNA recombinase
LDLAVWRDVCARLAHPERLAEASQRRRPPHDEARRQASTTLAVPLGQWAHGLARLIESEAEGRLETPAFEPRITRLRQRLGHLEGQRRPLAEDVAWQTELPLMIGPLEDLARQVHDGLAQTTWASKREMIRTLVKRLEVAHDHVEVVFRVEPLPGDSGPEKKSLQDCRRSAHTALRNARLGVGDAFPLQHACMQPFLDETQ